MIPSTQTIGLSVYNSCFYYTIRDDQHSTVPSVLIFITVAILIFVWLKSLFKPLSRSLPDDYFEFTSNEDSFMANKWYVKTLSFNKETHRVCKLLREDMAALTPMWPISMLRKKHLDEYFFGYLDRASVANIIRENGQFILGMNDHPTDRRCVLWFVWSNTLNRVLIDKIQGPKTSFYSIEKGKKFDTIGELIEYYSKF
uniref:SH2 domain-containing protein n=1 Tax=Romanomermis culicivorax TaxID=13658 RepID=A0A915I445_ROMCU